MNARGYRRRLTRLIAALATLAASGQCSVCGARLDGWNGGVCDACKATGRG